MDKINLQIIRESFGRVVYSHKTYEKECEIQDRISKKFKWVNLLVLTVGSSGLLGSLITDQNILLVIGAIFTFAGLGLAIFQMSFNPEEKAYKYKQTAHQLWQVREKYSCFIADIMGDKLQPEEIPRRRDQLLCDLDLIYKNSLPTTSDAYALASTALKKDEEFTFSDSEINKFLPKDLWLNHE
ncbi:MAG: SLATT domain-containing protein [Ignavibacteria bacterium]